MKKKAKKGISHLVVNSIFSALALFALVRAISIGPVSLVIALVSIKPLFVFIGAMLLSYFRPKFIQEKYDNKTMLKRISATALIVLGAILIVIVI